MSSQEDIKGEVPGIAVLETPSSAVDWTPSEERKAKLKLTFIVLPLLIPAFFSLQLDRGNIGNAITGTFYADVGINQDTLNNGQSLLLVMIVLFEIPSNLILQKIGAKWWLSCQMIAWGIVATAQCTIHNEAGFYLTRVLLGIGESGFIPGAIYYMSTMFTAKEMSGMIAWFYCGNIFGKACSGLLAAVILPLQGRAGLSGWSWLFLIEGVISIGIGIVSLLFLPNSPSDSKTLLGFSLFTQREGHILTNRVILADPMKSNRVKIDSRSVLNVLANWRMALHAAACIACTACATAVATYNASVIKSLDFPTSQANALSSVGSFLQILSLPMGYAMDRTRFKGPLVAGAIACLLVLNGVYFSFVTSAATVDKWSRYAVYELISGIAEPVFTGGLAWVIATARTPLQRSLFAAMYVMSSNSGQAIGGQMFRAADSPKYVNGFSAALALYSFAFTLTIILSLQYVWSNRNSKGDAGKELSGVVHVDDRDEFEAVKTFQYPI